MRNSGGVFRGWFEDPNGSNCHCVTIERRSIGNNAMAITAIKILKPTPEHSISISLRLPRLEVLLLADGVRFRQPFTEFLVDVGRAHESEIVNVISRRDCLNG